MFGNEFGRSVGRFVRRTVFRPPRLEFLLHGEPHGRGRAFEVAGDSLRKVLRDGSLLLEHGEKVFQFNADAFCKDSGLDPKLFEIFPEISAGVRRNVRAVN